MTISDKAPNLDSGTALLETGVRMHYYHAGEGANTLVLLHGWPETSWQWRHVIPLFADAGYRVVAPDYRGAGNSSRPRSDYGTPFDPRVEKPPRGGYDSQGTDGQTTGQAQRREGLASPQALRAKELTCCYLAVVCWDGIMRTRIVRTGLA